MVKNAPEGQSSIARVVSPWNTPAVPLVRIKPRRGDTTRHHKRACIAPAGLDAGIGFLPSSSRG